MRNSSVLVFLVVLLMLVHINRSELEPCEADISCLNTNCVSVKLSTTTSDLLCIDGDSSSSPNERYLIEGCNGSYTNSSGNNSGICVVTSSEKSDLYLTVSQLNTGVHNLFCFNGNSPRGDSQIITVTAIVVQTNEIEFDVVVEINNGKARQIPADDSEVTVTEGDIVRITARAVGVTEDLIDGSVLCTSDGMNCSRRPTRLFPCEKVLGSVFGQSLQFTYSPIALDETGLIITFTLGDITRSVSLNGELLLIVTEQSSSTSPSPSPTSTTTTKTPENDNTLSTGLIVAIVLTSVAVVAIVGIVVMIVVAIRKKMQSASTVTDFPHDPDKQVSNAYHPAPGAKQPAKAMLYLCPNCMDNERIVSELKNNGIEVVDLPDESTLTFMAIRNELYSLLNDGVALISCDCPRDTHSNLRRVVQRITNLPSEGVKTNTWNVFVISSADPDTNKLNKAVEVFHYSKPDEAVQKIRSRVVDGHRESITEQSLIHKELSEIKTGIQTIWDQNKQDHEEQMEGIQLIQTQNDVTIKTIQEQ